MAKKLEEKKTNSSESSHDIQFSLHILLSTNASLIYIGAMPPIATTKTMFDMQSGI